MVGKRLIWQGIAPRGAIATSIPKIYTKKVFLSIVLLPSPIFTEPIFRLEVRLSIGLSVKTIIRLRIKFSIRLLIRFPITLFITPTFRPSFRPLFRTPIRPKFRPLLRLSIRTPIPSPVCYTPFSKDKILLHHKIFIT